MRFSLKYFNFFTHKPFSKGCTRSYTAGYNDERAQFSVYYIFSLNYKKEFKKKKPYWERAWQKVKSLLSRVAGGREVEE